METEVQASKTPEQLKRSRAANMGVVIKNAPKIQELLTKVQAGRSVMSILTQPISFLKHEKADAISSKI